MHLITEKSEDEIYFQGRWKFSEFTALTVNAYIRIALITSFAFNGKMTRIIDDFANMKSEDDLFLSNICSKMINNL